MIPLDISLKGVGIAAGDYKANEVGSALAPYLAQIADEMANYARGRKTVVFLPLIDISQRFCELLKTVGFRAAEVNGNSDDRREILADFAAGRYDILCNSMLLTEGWDCPAVDCIVVLRPTKVRSLYCQMVGRGTRPAPGKSELLLLDFLWHTGRHDLCRPAHIIAPHKEIADAMTDIIKDYDSPIDIEEAEMMAKQDSIKQHEEALAAELSAQRRNKRRLVDPLQYALSIAAEDIVSYEPSFPWEMEPPTQKQLQALKKYQIDTEFINNKGMASKILSSVIERSRSKLSTPKQIRCLERKGFVNVSEWTKERANAIIGWLEAHNWMLPYNFDPSTYKPKETTA